MHSADPIIQIREEQYDQDLHCLLLCLHILDMIIRTYMSCVVRKPVFGNESL